MTTQAQFNMDADPSSRELATLDPFYRVKATLRQVLHMPPPVLPMVDPNLNDLEPDTMNLSGALGPIEPWYKRIFGTSNFSENSF